MSLIKKLILLAPIALLASSKHPIPPGGIIERQIEQEYEAKQIDAEKHVPMLEIDIPEKQLDLGNEKALIEKVTFSGNTIFSSKCLQKIVKSYLGKEISMKEIQEMCYKIQAKYAKRGYFLTRAYVPPQELKDATLNIEILEGKLGNITVVGNKHYSDRFIIRHFEKYQGKPINYDQILKALLLLDDNADLDVGAVFKKGTAFGTADLVVRVSDNRPIHVMIDHNNYGSERLSTKRDRTGSKFDFGNLLLDGDMLSLVEVIGEPISSLNFTSANYHIPFNTYGSAFDVSYLFAMSKTQKIKNVKYEGKSQIATLKFSQPLQRTRRLNTDVFTSFDYKQIQNFGNGERSSYDKLRVLTVGGQIDYIDGWKGRNIFSLDTVVGIPNFLGANKAKSHASSRDDGGALFVMLNGGWRRLQKLPFDCFLLFNTFMQYSFMKLPLPEQIYIGGVDTVRGYPLAVAIGDHGLYANLELRVPPPFLRAHKIPWTQTTWGEFVQFVGFADHGETYEYGHDIVRIIRRKKGKNEQTGEKLKASHLTSAGYGVRVYGPWRIEFSLDVGYPLTKQHRKSDTIVYYRVAWKIL